ncbi:hypothetical protein NW768_002917 [Fusarium equiseti]|uniref:Uncharacterized protein n=1 Tax=Fusarium equiseti TaxID=61235 RepID=A0ABQ8RKG2_FUSEQ|nr:hypothetical protein NW768_002917 [Fusarium equiseti]
MESKKATGAQRENETQNLNVENRRMTRSATKALQQQQAGPAAAGVSDAKDDQTPPPSTNKIQKANKIKKEEVDEKPKKAVRGKKRTKKNPTLPSTNNKQKATKIKKEDDEDESDEQPMKAVRVKKELETKENLNARPTNNKRKASEITKEEEDDDYKSEKASDIKNEDDHQPKKATPIKKMMNLGGEKRLRKFRDEPPKHWQGVYDRALSERFYVLNRTRVGTDSCPEEIVEMTGSTGNIYNVHIGRRISCNCPHHMRGYAQCKHICFVMKKMLNAPDDLLYQQALLSTELQSIFESAPDIYASQSQPQEESDKRKPIEGDCPICYCELKKENEEKPALVWCAAACGHNFHSQCFKLWARNKPSTSVTCPMCRSAWKVDEKLATTTVQKSEAKPSSKGYLNVADQLGLSGVRDTSTYSRGSR